MSEFSFEKLDLKSTTTTEATVTEEMGPGASLTLSAEALNSVVNVATATNCVQAGCRIKACASLEQRPPVDVVLVLDRSGSMAGGKLTLCKKTIDLLINELKPNDRFGLVVFDHQVQVTFEVECIGSKKEMMHEQVSKIITGGQTNLSGGLLKGLDILAKAGPGIEEGVTHDRVRAVFLLTDGQANVGITDMNLLRHAVNDAVATMPGAPPSVYTFGYGSAPNAALLQAIVPEERGGYYFVESTDKVLGAFADALGGLLSVVAQNVSLDIHAENASITKVRRDGAKRSSDISFSVDLGDIYAEEERDIVVEMKNNQKSDLKLIFNLHFVDALAGRMIHADPVTVLVKVTDDENVLKQNRTSTHLATQIARLDVADALADARSKADQGDFTSVQTSLGRVKSTIAATSALPQAPQDAELLRRLNFDVDMVQQSCATNDIYQARGRHQMTSKMMGHRAQRCYSDSDSDDDKEESQPKSRNMYRNAGKKAMKSKWMRFGSGS
uniref:VWFA domain-containing protein n=1 Tax=Aureoumbra lagunensis TaxID=44058 RepID=A0A7S3JX01_9STRA|mmetsp:Transcript_22372/g.28955  ORF Transcript_22372/g.28955 Transcript_22372/m.28955 type:complete len:499 (-) Transcript_22372:229-1725(-)|eukprot:CAMPEP_0197291098 /NCGR_PEP_ID=MMETSP0890-20130614/11653_1 /TAXON_ID=44058 ORGANISM="Aureoumbra lagunensis, Strain CCMP1510" /NCGR_SAMPLE_ID=MMETSP0890 /ASSEMBLY_ACC=CAM_ASM_000533 /LENGTH=498 /DNA_ID=CAMNT_0042763665 /DNA_START=70 /DNA_END=1566 /DNA_ORIENTATION=+